MVSLPRVDEKARVSCCITMDNVMMDSGEWINAKVRGVRYLATGVFMRASMYRIKCRVKGNTSGLMVRSTKVSGKTT